MLQKVKPVDRGFNTVALWVALTISLAKLDRVKRSATITDPKPPEMQRYLDNVIETRGKPTMVFPTAQQHLSGLSKTGTVDEGGVPRDSYGMPIQKVEQKTLSLKNVA